jgi:hypothetical protein
MEICSPAEVAVMRIAAASSVDEASPSVTQVQ